MTERRDECGRNVIAQVHGRCFDKLRSREGEADVAEGVGTVQDDVAGDAEVGESEGVVEGDWGGGGGSLCGDGGLGDDWTGSDGGAENSQETERHDAGG